MLSILGLIILLAVGMLLAMTLVITTPAEARPSARHHQSRTVSHHVEHRHHHRRSHRHARPHLRAAPVVQAAAAKSPLASLFSSVRSGASRVAAARAYIGMRASQLGLPGRLWCADFMNLIERRLGRSGTGSRAARSFASYGTRLSAPRVGAIAVLSRRGGGHVGVVTGIAANGNVIVVSGNHGRAVGEGQYSRRSIVAIVD